MMVKLHFKYDYEKTSVFFVGAWHLNIMLKG